jgi:hypothetical protein
MKAMALSLVDGTMHQIRIVMRKSPHPENPDLERRPNRHLSFGTGPIFA